MVYTSDHYNGKIFLNPTPTEIMSKGAFLKVLKKQLQRDPKRYPARRPGPFAADLDKLRHLPADRLRVTWLGHSSLLLEIDGKRFLTDPVWYQRASPFTRMGPRRFFENPVPLEALPPIDYILLSHDHYDHLDKGTMIYLMKKGVPVITMLKVGHHLESWGMDRKLITELDWWQSVTLEGGFTITATPARHFSGRWINDRFHTLWGAFAIKGPLHNVYYGADSGYYPGFATIGERLGPFDLTMLEIGAYNEEWQSIHLGPEAAIQAHQDLKGRVLLPTHWGTFSLAFHSWTEPVERIEWEAVQQGVALLLPAPGETCTVGSEGYNSRWWEAYE
ncbi:MAG TPA: MBL fold metallo-hydrolase [Chitinophagaceae bacterium]